jgi:hypothetical protein
MRHEDTAAAKVRAKEEKKKSWYWLWPPQKRIMPRVLSIGYEFSGDVNALIQHIVSLLSVFKIVILLQILIMIMMSIILVKVW